MSPTLRLFLALELPEAVREALGQAQRELKKSGADVRWVNPAAIHLTLKFLGETPAEKVEAIAQAAQAAAAGCPVLTLRPQGAGVFPKAANPRVVWIGLAGDLAPLARLAQDLETALAPLGFPPEGRPFSPHLTLGRVKSAENKAGLREAVLSLARFTGPEFLAPELILFRSELRPAGSIYTALRKLALGRA